MPKTLHIFDFDDTLMHSDAVVGVTHKDGTTLALTSGEFASYEPKPGDDFDFSEFESYPAQGEPIPFIFSRLQQVLNSAGSGDAIILTARSRAKPVREFLQDHGIKSQIQIIALGSSNSSAKGNYVKGILEGSDYEHVHVYEDNISNIKSIEDAVTDAGIGFSHTLVTESSNTKNGLEQVREFVRYSLLEYQHPKKKD